ncbi:SOS response regulatory protein OraA/RecX [Microbacterium sp. 1154]|uniref:regulatory protein RecX n=1 Tax=Microbacterium sp. 1154 TaxID=2817733 RepID=UPI00285949F9|nr:regulatory protein RecX [Microbacterium sp. 1154]MDR6690702.1 SOS response regulatory protein OraA/RecX [Microbacterium sp. 1154]
MTDDTWDFGRRRPAGTGGDRGPDDVGERDHSRDWGAFEESPTGSGLRPVDDSDLAPVIPLFGTSARSRGDHPSRRDAVANTQGDAAPAGESTSPPIGRPRLSVVGDDHEDGASAPDRAEIRERAEAILLRKLRSRSLSLSEARAVVRGVDGADESLADELVGHFVDLGYLDDAAFAEQLAMSAVERKGEGRRAVAETLRKRGIPRDIAEATLAELPDDDAERALDFARSKVRGVEGKDYDAALRRLAGQLSRRGYPSSVALTAARTALEEAGIGRSRSFSRPSSGVRFTPDS